MMLWEMHAFLFALLPGQIFAHQRLRSLHDVTYTVNKAVSLRREDELFMHLGGKEKETRKKKKRVRVRSELKHLGPERITGINI